MTRFTADGEPWAGLVVANAMGVRQEFYAPLAQYLSEHGIHARMVQTARPGYVVYEDAHQVAAEPFRGDGS